MDPQPPAPLVIDWKTPDEIAALGATNPNLCVMVYFPDPVVSNNILLETVTFADQELVKIINDTFVALAFPVTASNAQDVMNEFQIPRLPAIIMAPSDDQMVFQIQGTPPPDHLKEAIESHSQEGELFEKCVEERAKVE